MKVTVLVDGFPVERCFTMRDLREAVAYWSERGEVSVRNDPNLITLHAPAQA